MTGGRGWQKIEQVLLTVGRGTGQTSPKEGSGPRKGPWAAVPTWSRERIGEGETGPEGRAIMESPRTYSLTWSWVLIIAFGFMLKTRSKFYPRIFHLFCPQETIT